MARRLPNKRTLFTHNFLFALPLNTLNLKLIIFQKYNLKSRSRFRGCLTRLTWLTHTSLLPSNWDLDKIFALAVELGQVHMANKNFPIFLHAGGFKTR